MYARRLTLVTIGAWSVIALVSAAELYQYTQRTPHPITFGHALAIHAPGWAAWALATPLIVRLSRRFPLEWPPGARAISAHVAGCAAAVAAFTVASVAAGHAFPFQPARAEGLEELWNHIVSWAPFSLMAYASVVGVGHALSYAERVACERAEKAALATQLAQAQLAALRMQLQPHFLFNTLNSIAMLVRDEQPARAVEMIVLLGEVLRTLLRASSELEAPLASELALLRRYLDIEQIRFGDRLRVTWQVESAAEAALVPSLILQPLVENALRHGLWPMTGGGELTLAARRADGALELEVRDDGIGVPSGFDPARASGVGLANVRTRLARMFGHAGQLDVVPRVPRGTCVRLRLPYRDAHATAASQGPGDA